MKKTILILLAPMVFISLLQGCKKSNVNSNNLPAVINTIVSQDILDSMQKWGMAINAGTTPPSINGIYFLHPDSCTFNNSKIATTTGPAGTIYDDYKIMFSNQNNSSYTINVGYNNVSNLGADSSFTSTGTFISGNGNLFTVFSQQKAATQTYSYTSLSIFSGEIIQGGVKNLQLAIYLQSKNGDPNNVYSDPMGTSKIFIDANGLSELSTNYDTDNPQGIYIPTMPQHNTIGRNILSVPN